MKKSVLFLICVALICVACLTLTACNNATPQGQLGNYFSKYEKYTYAVHDSKNNINGTYELEIKEYAETKNSVVLSDGFTLENKSAGHLIKSTLNIGSKTYVTACYYTNVSGNSYYLPQGSYKSVTDNGTELYSVKVTYSAGSKSTNANYTLTENGKTPKKGSLSLKSPYYDNLEFYTMLRGASTMGTSFSMSYNVALVAPNEITSATISASCSSTEKVSNLPETVFDGGKADCYKVSISRNTKVAGTSYTVYYAKSNVKKLNGVDCRPLVRVMTKIVEGDVTYTLSGVEASNI